jgi:hypothetical protein
MNRFFFTGKFFLFICHFFSQSYFSSRSFRLHLKASERIKIKCDALIKNDGWAKRKSPGFAYKSHHGILLSRDFHERPEAPFPRPKRISYVLSKYSSNRERAKRTFHSSVWLTYLRNQWQLSPEYTIALRIPKHLRLLGRSPVPHRRWYRPSGLPMDRAHGRYQCRNHRILGLILSYYHSCQ